MPTHNKTTLFVNNLTVSDFSFLCAQKGLVGESWIIDLQLSGNLNPQGMIFDFGDVKKRIKQVIDNLFDHKLLVPAQSPNLEDSLENSLEESLELDPTPQDSTAGAEHSLRFQYQRHQDAPVQYIAHRSPSIAICALPITHITPETVRPHLIKAVKSILPSNVQEVDLTIRCESTEQPYFHYSHGLQYHDGDCQRIAHGHRSRLEIRMNDTRCSETEKAWCRQWSTIYIATRAHLQQHESRLLPKTAQPNQYCTLSYQAAQGEFEITLPRDMIHFIDKESTIEHLAEHIALNIAAQFPDRKIEVKAFEGVNKGAISTLLPP